MKVYRSAPSQGFLWLWGIALLMLAGVVPNVLAVPLLSLGAVTLMVLFLAMAWWYPTIRYELDVDWLVLRFGPFRWPVRIAEITAVERKSLRPSLLSSMRVPGFAMFTVLYSDEGNVLMCATRAMEDIVLITTSSGRKYGITPREAGEFLTQLRSYLQKG